MNQVKKLLEPGLKSPEQVLDYGSEYKCLGYWINDHLDNKILVEKVGLAARRSLGSLIAKSKGNGGFSAQTYSYLYSTLIMPIIDYSCCVWGYEKQSFRIEMLCNIF